MIQGMGEFNTHLTPFFGGCQFSNRITDSSTYFVDLESPRKNPGLYLYSTTGSISK